MPHTSGHRWLFISISLVWFSCSSASSYSSSERTGAFALHFASVCLVGYVLCFYTEVGTYRDLDLAIAILKNAALIVFPPLFLHFCLLYPVRQQLFERKRWRAALLYVPALLLLALESFIFLRSVLTPLVPQMRNVPNVSDVFVGLFYG